MPKSKKKASRPATSETGSVKASGGGGFGFESKVAATYLAFLLSGRRPLGSDYPAITAIQFQTHDSGWIFDDLVLELGTDADRRYFAISSKSNRQLTQSGFKSEFVSQAWRQWNADGSSPFRRTQDALGLVTAHVSHEVKCAFDAMLAQLQKTDTDRAMIRFASRGSSSAIQRSIFSGLKCPLACGLAESDEILQRCQLLKSLRVVHFDFESIPSSAEAEIIALCQNHLQNNDYADGLNLWNRLCHIASDFRQTGGSLDLPKLLELLRDDFALTGHPDYRADWNRLSALTKELIDEVRSDISQCLCLLRPEVVQGLSKTLDTHSAVVLLGDSGCGKSSLMKQVAYRMRDSQVVWLNDYVLEGRTLMDVESRLELVHSLVDVLLACPNGRAVLMVDGINRFSSAAMENLRKLLNAVEQGGRASCWKVIITCQLDKWEDVGPGLLRQIVDSKQISEITVQNPTPKDLGLISESCPALKLFSVRQELRDLLRSFTVIDRVASASQTTSQLDTSSWIGLSDLIQWLWKGWITDGPDRFARAQLLKRLSDFEARALTSGVPVSQFASDETLTLARLEQAGLIRSKNERVWFTHDLIGDWARQRILVEEQSSADELRKRAAYPLWHRAIRLYGQELVEQSRNDAKEWTRLVSDANDGTDFGALVSDLLLESAFLASNAGVLLERVWPVLVGGKGVLLRRMLRRFLFSATVPDPRVRLWADDEDTIRRLASRMRIPYWPDWVTMIPFLHRHRSEVKTLAIGEVSSICKLWLGEMPVESKEGKPFPWRAKVAQIALDAAREVQSQKAEGHHFHDEEDKLVYEAALLAARELPDEVAALALELSRRREPSPEVKQRVDSHKREHEERIRQWARDNPEQVQRRRALITSSRLFGPDRAPWPDGPAQRVDDDFQHVCLGNSRAFATLISARPNVAKEVLLALCIEPPKPIYYDHDDLMMTFGTESWIEGGSSLYIRGPFLQFLQLNPEHGLDCIIRLVNFATARWEPWEQGHRSRYGSEPSQTDFRIRIPLPDGAKEWLGDLRVYGWYRNRLVGSHTLVCSLMALEKWLYDELERGEDVSKWIQQIYSSALSVAFLGVLSAVGKKCPQLFEGQLRPLLGVWQVYGWDRQVTLDEHARGIEAISWVREGEWFFNMAKEWHTLPHRKQGMLEHAIQLLLSQPGMQEYFQAVRTEWSAQLESGTSNESLELLIARFDPENYTAEWLDERRIQIGLQWPEHLRQRTEDAVRQSDDFLALMNFPIRCRQILKGEADLNASELDQFVAMVRKVSEQASSDNSGRNERSRVSAICGGLAVIYIKHRDWLYDTSKNEEWFHEQLAKVLNGPQLRDEMDSAESMYDIDYDRFLGELFVHLLGTDPSNPNLRILVARSVASFHYETTAYTMRAAWGCRTALGDTFIEMQNLAVEWAAVRAMLRHDEYQRKHVGELTKRYERLVKRFATGKCSRLAERWEVFAKEGRTFINKRRRNREAKRTTARRKREHGSYLQQRRRTPHTHPGLDVQVLQNAFSWVPDLTNVTDASTRNNIIHIVRELLGVTLSIVGRADPDGGEIEGTPYPFDYWLFGQVATLIPQLRREEHPEELWAPLLDLGPAAHYWVESFLSRWFTDGYNAAKSPSVFVPLWREMLGHCLTSRSWDPERCKAGYRLDGMVAHLLGLDLGAETIGKEEFADYVIEMEADWQTWTAKWLRCNRIVERFSYFLTKPGAGRLLPKAIRWLYEASIFATDGWWTWADNRTEANVVAALHLCWTKHRHAVESESGLQAAFRGLLATLASRQNADALHLQAEVLRSLRPT